MNTAGDTARITLRSPRWVHLTVMAFIGSGLLAPLGGCFDLAMQEHAPSEIPAKLTSSNVRAVRRAYDGAPPVIPHAPQSASCVVCHTGEGAFISGMGTAPANPHHGSDRAGSLQDCRQCHVFVHVDKFFVANDFQGLPQSLVAAERAHMEAPPVIPHLLLMRENCFACHSGPAARPEIRCSHPERVSCRQCHVARDFSDRAVFPEGRSPDVP